MYSNIYEVKERWKNIFMRRKGVVGVGIGPDEIIVFVEPTITITPSIPKQIEGIPVRVEITGAIRIYD